MQAIVKKDQSSSKPTRTDKKSAGDEANGECAAGLEVRDLSGALSKMSFFIQTFNEKS